MVLAVAPDRNRVVSHVKPPRQVAHLDPRGGELGAVQNRESEDTSRDRLARVGRRAREQRQ